MNRIYMQAAVQNCTNRRDLRVCLRAIPPFSACTAAYPQPPNQQYGLGVKVVYRVISLAETSVCVEVLDWARTIWIYIMPKKPPKKDVILVMP